MIRELAHENALGSMRLCGRCRCCSLEERRVYLSRSGPRMWDSIVAYGECVGKCHVDGHTEASVEAARSRVRAEQAPLRAYAKRQLTDAEDEYHETITRLDKEYADV